MSAIQKNSPLRFLGTSKFYRQGLWGKKQDSLLNLKLTVPNNCIYGFLGANGAGKTTAIKILMGLQFASAGSVELFGESPQSSAARSRVGYLPERPYFHDSLTAKEFLDFHRSLFGSYLPKKHPSNAELLEIVGLANTEEKLLKNFSKGMLQRVGIAQALVNDPDLVVLDEPMSGLDPVGRREVRILIRSLQERGKTIFFSTHILSDAESLCDRVAFLEKGVLKYEGDLSVLKNSMESGMDIHFAGLDLEKQKNHPLLRQAILSGTSYVLEKIPFPEAQKAMQEIHSLGGQILSAQSAHKSLEEHLFGKGKT